MFAGMTLRIVIAGVALFAAFLAGVRLEAVRWKASEADRLAAAIKERQVDESFTRGVSSAYEQVAAQLRRMSAVNRIEVQRETTRVEYRCPLPDAGRVLLNANIDAANRAAGQPDPALPADPKTDGGGPRRTGDSLFGTDGDLR